MQKRVLNLYHGFFSASPSRSSKLLGCPEDSCGGERSRERGEEISSGDHRSCSSRSKMLLDPISIDQWATENSHCFAPPIMNKLMHKKYALLAPLILPSTQERPSRLPHDSLLTPLLAQAAHHHVCWRPQHEDRLSRRGRIRAVHHDEGKYVGETTPRHSLARSPSRTPTAWGLRNAESSV